MIKRILLLTYLVLFSAAATAVSQATTTPAATDKPDFCPEIAVLSKAGLFWSAPGGWTSYGESFDTKVVRFIKAEWIGINYGRVICIYRGDKRIAFPIALEQKRTKLAPSPAGLGWSKDLGGRKECFADNVKNCPFYFKKETQPKNIYDELDFFKGKSDSDY